jgi:replicative DNA helicase
MEMVSTLPPHSTDAEKAVLGCLLLNGELVHECLSLLPDAEKSFYDMRNQLIYKTLMEMSLKGLPITVISLYQTLKDTDRIDLAGGLEYINPLPDVPPGPSTFSYFADIVQKKAALRKTIRVCSDISTEAYEQMEDVHGFIDRAETTFLAATKRNASTIATQCKPIVLKALTRIEGYIAQQGQLSGISTGFTDFDRLTTGLHGGEMIVIAARPSMGKTSLAMNIAEFVAVEAKLPVGVLSFEMSKDQLIERMICSRARVNPRSVRSGYLPQGDVPKIAAASKAIADSPLYIDDQAGLTILDVKARARRMVQLYGIKLFVIDYLQLMQAIPRKGQSRTQEVGEMSVGCKQMAKDLDVPVIVLAQLNRESDRDKKRKPRMSDLRESGNIEQDADLIGLLYKPDSDDDDDLDAPSIPVNLLIAKQRNGPCDEIQLTFLRQFTRFVSAAKVGHDYD